MPETLIGFLDGVVPAWLYEILFTTVNNLYNGITAPLFAKSRINISFLFISALFAVFSYIYYAKKDNRDRSIRGFFSFLTPKDVYLSNSALVDLKIYLGNKVVSGLLSPLKVLLSSATIAALVNYLLSSQLTSPGWSEGPYGLYLFALIYLMAYDFAYYVGHTAAHKLPVLWEIHALHHSAKVLNPLTLFRTHPLNFLFAGLIKSSISGVLIGILLFLFLGSVDVYKIFGMNFIFFIFTFAASNLRHSHIWLSWGHLLNHVFISPAHHQIHHSSRMKHWGKNNGQIFALWDWMFGTLVLPTEELRGKLVFGLTPNDPDPHVDLKTAYVGPLQNIFKIVRERFTKQPLVDRSA